MGGWLHLFRLCKHYSVNVHRFFTTPYLKLDKVLKTGPGPRQILWWDEMPSSTVQQKPSTHKLFKTELGLLGTTVTKVKIRVKIRVSRVRMKIRVSREKFRV